MGGRHHVHLDGRGLGLPGGAARPVLASSRGLGAAQVVEPRARRRGAEARSDIAKAAARPRPSHRSRLPVRERRLPRAACPARRRLQHERRRELLRQRRCRELFRNSQEGARARLRLSKRDPKRTTPSAITSRTTTTRSGATPPLETNHPSTSSWPIPVSLRHSHINNLSGISGELQAAFPPLDPMQGTLYQLALLVDSAFDDRDPRAE